MRIIAVLMLVLAACDTGKPDHDDHGHEHAEEAHDETVKWTHVGPVSQVYAEWAPAKVGQRTEFVIHLTDTTTWVSATYSGDTSFLSEGDGPSRVDAARAPSSMRITGSVSCELTMSN